MRTPLDAHKFPGSLSAFQTGSNLSVPNLAHPTAERIPYQEALIHDGFALKVLVPGERDSLVGALRRIAPWPQLLARSRAALTTTSG
jgi:hypothetical protein